MAQRKSGVGKTSAKPTKSPTPASSTNYYFEDINGLPIPRESVELFGGPKIYSLKEAGAHFRWAESSLAKLYKRVLQSDDRPETIAKLAPEFTSEPISSPGNPPSEPSNADANGRAIHIGDIVIETDTGSVGRVSALDAGKLICRLFGGQEFGGAMATDCGQCIVLSEPNMPHSL